MTTVDKVTADNSQPTGLLDSYIVRAKHFAPAVDAIGELQTAMATAQTDINTAEAAIDVVEGDVATLEESVEALEAGVDVIATASVPVAAVGYRGKIILEYGGNGVADVMKICVKGDAGTYSWVTFSLSTHTHV